MIDERDRAGRTKLHYAAVDDKLELLLKLISGGADINAKEEEGWAPLHFAASQGNLDIARALLDAGADIDAVNGRGQTPLFRAILAGNRGRARDLVKFLLEKGANPNQADVHGESPATFVMDFHPDDPVKAMFDTL